VVVVEGNLVWTEPTCGAILDPASARALGEIQRDLARAGAHAPLFQIDVRKIEGDRAILASTKLFGNGEWALDDTRATPARHDTGRINGAQLEQIRDDLARATWKSRPLGIMCRARGSEVTEFRENGRLVWTQQVCQSQALDQVSKQSLDDIEKILRAATTQQLACAPSGTPLVELDERERVIAVYRDGAWTLDTKPDAKIVTQIHERKCLSKDVVKTIADDAKNAPWISTPVVHCMAMSIDYRTVKVDGKAVWTERICNPAKLDDVSANMLVEIEKLMLP
jgi:hypothetical protein